MPRKNDVSVSAQIDEKDFSKIAETIVEEYRGRKKRRDDLEKHWDEVDRQLRMKPEISHKLLANGQRDPSKAWMPEVELPLQAQTLEMLSSDVRRLIFPANRDFFQARAALTESYVRRWSQSGSPFPGERGARGEDPRAVMSQDNADRLAAAMVAHWHAQYDFRGNVDQINAQTLSYGFGVGRIRKVRRRILGHDARLNGFQNQRIPVLIPRDARKVYLDDNVHSIMHEGHSLGPNIIQTKSIKLADLIAAAKDGGSDPKDEEGGFVISEITKLTAKQDGTVDLLELEGDLVIDRDRDTVIIQDVVVTVAVGGAAKGGKETSGFVRFREGEEFSTYLIQHYHLEGSSYVYGASPLLKGMPIAKVAAQAMNRVIESSALKNSPPIGYDKNDLVFAATGGPVVQPYALWGTADPSAIKAYVEVGGDPAQLWNIVQGLLKLYVDVTGVNAPRLGAQTKSHTTAFAKDVELSQGAVRTVDFVRSVLEGPMERFLQLEYRMGLSLMKGRQTIYVEPWNEFVTIRRDHLPDIVKFTAIGAAAPAEEQAMYAKQLSSAQMALQIDSMAMQMGRPPKVDHGKLIEQLLLKGGWSANELLVPSAEGAPSGPEPQPDVGLAAGVPGIISQRNAALEALG